jgi:hypothetical protein
MSPLQIFNSYFTDGSVGGGLGWGGGASGTVHCMSTTVVDLKTAIGGSACTHTHTHTHTHTCARVQVHCANSLRTGSSNLTITMKPYICASTVLLAGIISWQRIIFSGESK